MAGSDELLPIFRTSRSLSRKITSNRIWYASKQSRFEWIEAKQRNLSPLPYLISSALNSAHQQYQRLYGETVACPQTLLQVTISPRSQLKNFEMLTPENRIIGCLWKMSSIPVGSSEISGYRHTEWTERLSTSQHRNFHTVDPSGCQRLRYLSCLSIFVMLKLDIDNVLDNEQSIFGWNLIWCKQSIQSQIMSPSQHPTPPP